MSRIAWAGERGLSAISIHLPDEDALNEADVRLIRECRPTSLLAIRYPWDTDKGAAKQVIGLVRELGHDTLVIRFHDEAISNKEPRAWTRECFERMRIYDALRPDVTLHAILGNEMNLVDVEGGHQDWGRHAWWLGESADEWHRLSGDPLHLPAPSRQRCAHSDDWNQCNESIDYWKAIRDAAVHLLYDQWDVHAYAGDYDRAIQEGQRILGFKKPDDAPEWGSRWWVTEANRVSMQRMALSIADGRVQCSTWFTADWRNYDNPSVPRADDEGMSLLKFRERRDEFMTLLGWSPPAASEPPGGTGVRVAAAARGVAGRGRRPKTVSRTRGGGRRAGRKLQS